MEKAMTRIWGWLQSNLAQRKQQRECPVLCAAIEQALPKWADVQAEYDADNDEAYNGGLDPAFSSWEDFWNWKGY